MSKQLEWKRAKIRETDIAKIWRWESHCGRYCVEFHKYKLAQGASKKQRLLPKYFAMKSTDMGWRFLRTPAKRHPTREAAEAACQRHVDGLLCGTIVADESGTGHPRIGCSCTASVGRQPHMNDRKWRHVQKQFRETHRGN